MIRRIATALLLLVSALIPAACQEALDPPAGSTVPPLDLAAGRSRPVADPVYPDFGNPAIDVLGYDLTLRWSPDRRRLAGTARLVVRGVRDVPSIRLDFARTLALDGITVEGRDAKASRHKNDLVIAHQLRRGTRVSLTVDYHGRPRPVPAPSKREEFPTVGFISRPDGTAWALQEPYGAFTWYPVSDQPSDEAVYDVAITVPRGWAAVSTGAFLGTEERDGRVTYRWRSDVPVASYVVTLAIGRYHRYRDTGPHGIPVTYWVPEAAADRVLPRARKTPRMLAWLEKRFGPYPFERAGLVHIDARAGLETQQTVTLDLGAPEEVFLHEYAHQWFGNTVTPRTWRDLWLNEGFALYVQMLYEVDRLGADQAEIIAQWRAADGELRRRHGPPGAYDPKHFGARNVYICTALMLHEIRDRIGDETFFAMMRDWVQEHRGTTQDRESFIAWLNDYTGRDLSGLVNRWLESPTTPA